jgi:hypothetical protein
MVLNFVKGGVGRRVYMGIYYPSDVEFARRLDIGRFEPESES